MSSLFRSQIYFIILKIVLSAFVVLCLFGFAEIGPVDTAGRPVNDVMPVFQKGEIRLSCDLQCTEAWGANRNNVKRLHDLKRWKKLALETAKVGYRSDQAYYYLARAAEGLGYTKAAKTYYKLALESPTKCEANILINNCDGLEFPAAVYERQNVIAKRIKKTKKKKKKEEAIADRRYEEAISDNENEYVGSIFIVSPLNNKEYLTTCTLDHEGDYSAAVIGYRNSSFEIFDDDTRELFSDKEIIFKNTDDNVFDGGVFKNNEEAISFFKNEKNYNPTICDIYISNPKNILDLKKNISRKFMYGKLLKADEARDLFAVDNGYESYDEYNMATTLKLNSYGLELFRKHKINNLDSYSNTTENIKNIGYSEQVDPETVASYLRDKEEAENKKISIIEQRNNRLAAEKKAEADRLAAEKKAEADRLAAARAAAKAAREKASRLKIKNVGLGSNKNLPCNPSDETYVDIVRTPVRLQYECTAGSLKDKVTVIFSGDKRSVVKIIRDQYFDFGQRDQITEIIKAAIKHYGKPDYFYEGNWIANYGNAYEIADRGKDIDENNSGSGLLINGQICGDGRYGTLNCGNLGSFVIKYILVDQNAYQKSIEAGKLRLKNKQKKEISNQSF